jgi:hypothetical protein
VQAVASQTQCGHVNMGCLPPGLVVVLSLRLRWFQHCTFCLLKRFCVIDLVKPMLW